MAGKVNRKPGKVLAAAARGALVYMTNVSASCLSRTKDQNQPIRDYLSL